MHCTNCDSQRRRLQTLNWDSAKMTEILGNIIKECDEEDEELEQEKIAHQVEEGTGIIKLC